MVLPDSCGLPEMTLAVEEQEGRSGGNSLFSLHPILLSPVSWVQTQPASEAPRVQVCSWQEATWKAESVESVGVDPRPAKASAVQSSHR